MTLLHQKAPGWNRSSRESTEIARRGFEIVRGSQKGSPLSASSQIAAYDAFVEIGRHPQRSGSSVSFSRPLCPHRARSKFAFVLPIDDVLRALTLGCQIEVKGP